MSKDRCPMCGEGKLETRHEARRYGRGINVTLVNVPVRRCPSCGEEIVIIPAIEELHKLIANDLARSRGRLGPGEIRFLHTYLGYSSREFARTMGVAPETVSRWENQHAPQKMTLTAERLLRLMALQDRPIKSYGLEDAGADEKVVPGPIRLRPTAAGWAAA